MLQKDIFEIAFSSFGHALESHCMEHRSLRLTSAVRHCLPETMQLESMGSDYVN